ncbi:DMT family transporter [Desulforamulus ruminis]|uniref:EamA domain-containing protein n=1 Tax=Desulforamulus ruminis (strain ATCC 23193 / DSM 2154 / NCIMB 8452 / DL) TaxID=696281 RepID=F6DQY2_DESRL|nr:DMT family transporter [Desulforamulus ruminis]AEG58706.1 protein of unknown function DUF6 transmembrane [Desulforamulus ruminis DSM 2154]
MPLKGYLYVILSAIASALLPVFYKLGYHMQVTTDTLLAMRFFISAAILMTLAVATKKIQWASLKPCLGTLAVQAVIYFASAVFYILATKYMLAAVASMLFYAYPAIVLLIMTLYYHEKLSVKRLISLGLVILGCLMVINLFSQDFDLNWQGIACGLMGALMFAIYIIRGQKISREIDPVTVIACITTICSLFVVLIFPPVTMFTSPLTLPQFLVGLGSAVFCTVLALTLYLMGLAKLGASRTSIISTIELAFTIGFAWLILSEKLSAVQLLGSASIIAGIIILQTETEEVPEYSKKPSI